MTRVKKVTKPAKKDDGVKKMTDDAVAGFKVRSEDVANWAITEHVEGTIVALDALLVKKAKRRYMSVDTGTRLYRVFETTGLTPVFDAAEVGDRVTITHLGQVTTRTAGRRFHRFSYQLQAPEA